ncbi:MAG: hypothetical protein ACQEWL_19680 [Pseudomonadota bacterium]
MIKDQKALQYDNLMRTYIKLLADIELPQNTSLDEVKQWLVEVCAFMSLQMPTAKQYKEDIRYFLRNEELGFLDHRLIAETVKKVGCELRQYKDNLDC